MMDRVIKSIADFLLRFAGAIIILSSILYGLMRKRSGKTKDR